MLWGQDLNLALAHGKVVHLSKCELCFILCYLSSPNFHLSLLIYFTRALLRQCWGLNLKPEHSNMKSFCINTMPSLQPKWKTPHKTFHLKKEWKCLRRIMCLNFARQLYVYKVFLCFCLSKLLLKNGLSQVMCLIYIRNKSFSCAKVGILHSK